ncbi:MAG: toxin [Cellulomonadaceae bacterium]|nr:toxin [Cellulomonadaceae bacterium]
MLHDGIVVFVNERVDVIEVHKSARKHGLNNSTIRALWVNWLEQCWLEDDSPGRVLRLCLDDAGRAFEVIGIVFDDDRVLVIHAMPLRQSTLAILRRAR